ncbi:recombinational DNA repair ATPase RecF [Oribacterium sinus]|uniref:Recombinational DNA repair ATPase RecF n=1 Tax=Oribacterium sinus TaxID=237576 RepID=A0A7W9W154_9FIRM|nr:ATP-binding protein [Oribacterium sinus]MBB6040505.1 recombinational DNA repair ATPase RecF [Oribacterium sinus]
MIIEACHIAQFGKWKDADFSFSPGKNSFLWDNGYGKTSFIYFFKLMFYGVSGDRKQDLEENERKHYMPFQGASFGGRIIFRIGEKRYRLERSFGLKKSEDSFRLFDEDSGKESKDYSENIGEELFSLDAESFQRVCMISHEDLHFSMNSRMHAKLGNVAEDQEDMKKFQQVQTILKDGINALSPNRRTGNIFKLKMQEEELSSGLYGKEALENAVLSIEKEVLSLTEKEARRKEEGKALEAELSQRISEKDSLGKWMSYAQKKEEWEKAEYRYENALKWYYQDRFSEIPEEKKALLWKEEMQSLQEQIHSIKKEIEKVSEVSGENVDVEVEKEGGIVLPLEEASVPGASRAKKDTSKNETFGNGTKEMGQYGTSPVVLFALVGLGLLFVLLFFGKLFGMPLGLPSALFLLLGILSLSLCFFLWWSGEQKKRTWKEKQEEEEARQRKQQAIRFASLEELLSRFHKLEDMQDLEMEAAGRKEEFLRFVEEEGGEQAFSLLEEKQKEWEEGPSLEESRRKLEAFRKEEEERREEIRKKRAEREAKVRDLEFLEEQERLLEQKKEEREALEKRYNLLQKTKAYLEMAKERFALQYKEPILEAFQKYFQSICTEPLQFQMSEDLELSFVDRGLSREQGYLSEGLQDLCRFCQKLAIFDAMFREEKAFLLLDDPFSHLDEKNGARARALLEELAKSRQIFYFTCSEERKS